MLIISNVAIVEHIGQNKISKRSLEKPFFTIVEFYSLRYAF